MDPLISYDLYTTVKQMPLQTKDYKFYNVVQGGGGNRFHSLCKRSSDLFEKQISQDKIKVLFNITSFDRIDTILNKDDINYIQEKQSHSGNESTLVSKSSFDLEYWNLDYAWGIGNTQERNKKSNQIENRSWVQVWYF